MAQYALTTADKRSVKALMCGATPKQIAQQWAISTFTVRSQLQRVTREMSFATQQALCRHLQQCMPVECL